MFFEGASLSISTQFYIVPVNLVDWNTILHCHSKYPLIISYSHMFVFNLSVPAFSGSLSTLKIASHNLLRKTTVRWKSKTRNVTVISLVSWKWNSHLTFTCMAFWILWFHMNLGLHKNCHNIINRLPTFQMHELLNFVGFPHWPWVP